METRAARALTERIREANAIPTWEDAEEITGKPFDFTGQPAAPAYDPYLWSWATMKPLLMEAGELLTPERGAERRSIDHVNPSLPEHSLSTTHAIGTAMQLVRPGEVAPAHRHTAAAIRFVLESGSPQIYTAVNGERLLMETGDLLLTPSMSWHDHHNNSDHDLIWFDALDYPLVNFLRASFFETYPEGEQPITKDDGHSIRHSGPLRPAYEDYDHDAPVLRFPWRDVESALSSARRADPHPHHGYCHVYSNPFTGGPTLPTFNCYIQALPARFKSRPYRTNASRALVVVEGAGRSRIGGHEYRWTRGDVLSVPPGSWIVHENTGDAEAQFFYVSEEPLLKSLKIWRDEMA